MSMSIACLYVSHGRKFNELLWIHTDLWNHALDGIQISHRNWHFWGTYADSVPIEKHREMQCGMKTTVCLSLYKDLCGGDYVGSCCHYCSNCYALRCPVCWLVLCMHVWCIDDSDYLLYLHSQSSVGTALDIWHYADIRNTATWWIREGDADVLWSREHRERSLRSVWCWRRTVVWDQIEGRSVACQLQVWHSGNWLWQNSKHEQPLYCHCMDAYKTYPLLYYQTL